MAPALAALRAQLGDRRPQVAVILGSGLAGVVQRVAQPVRIPFAALPGFVSTSVAGHPGELVVGHLGGRAVLAQLGRTHLYEGKSAEAVVYPVRVYAALGISTLILCNAAGGIRRSLAPAALMLIADHLNLMYRNPLLGPVYPGETRFPDCSDPYDRELRALTRRVALDLGLALEEGVYAGVLGPSYETPAEIRMLARFGADAVGMSTVPEVLAARASGVRCLGFSVITNLAAGLSGEVLTHDRVTEVTAQASGALARLLEGVLARL